MAESTTKMETIELIIPEHLLLTYAMLAHEQDITLNQWFLNAVMERLNEVDANDKATLNK